MKANQFVRDTRGDSGAVRDIAIGGILVAISFIVVLSVLPTLNSQVNTTAGDANASTTVVTLVKLIPLVFVAGLVIAGIGFLVKGVRGL